MQDKFVPTRFCLDINKEISPWGMEGHWDRDPERLWVSILGFFSTSACTKPGLNSVLSLP